MDSCYWLCCLAYSVYWDDLTTTTVTFSSIASLYTLQRAHMSEVMCMIYTPSHEMLSRSIHLVTYPKYQTRYRNVYAGNVRLSGVRDKC